MDGSVDEKRYVVAAVDCRVNASDEDTGAFVMKACEKNAFLPIIKVRQPANLRIMLEDIIVSVFFMMCKIGVWR